MASPPVLRDDREGQRESEDQAASVEKLDQLALHFFVQYYKSAKTDMVARLVAAGILMLFLALTGALVGLESAILATIVGVYVAMEIWFARAREVRLRSLTEPSKESLS